MYCTYFFQVPMRLNGNYTHNLQVLSKKSKNNFTNHFSALKIYEYNIISIYYYNNLCLSILKSKCLYRNLCQWFRPL